jgi:hypothetical protein
VGKEVALQLRLCVTHCRKLLLFIELRNDNVDNELRAPASAGAHNTLIVLSRVLSEHQNRSHMTAKSSRF